MSRAATASDWLVSLTMVGVIIGGLLLLDIDEANRVARGHRRIRVTEYK
jgi:hypothetical protein